MSFPKYPAYKDSGVEWIGEIPEGWSVSSIKRCSYLKARVGWKGLTSDEFEESSYAYLVTGSDFKSSRIQWRQCYQVNKARYDDDPFIHLIEGDLLITKDGTVGKLALVEGLDKPACLNSGIFLLRPLHSYLTNFMEWVLRSKLFSHFVDLRSYGSTINHLYQNVFEEFSFPLPTLSEQKAIASFLDRECTKIDALITEQERLITLLQEKRLAVITHAVTKGLEPNVGMQDSGIEWIGEVPQTYQIIRLSLLFNIISSGTTPTTDNENFYDGNIAWVTTGELKEKGISETTKNITELAFSHFPALRLYPPNTLLIAMYGATIGRLGWLEVAAATNQACCALANSRQVEMKFIFYTLLAAKQSLVLLSSGGGQPNINQDKIRSFKVPVPSLAEQKQIILHLDKSTSEIDDLINHANQNASLLKERRSALISAAVTGKIDVRTLAKPKDIAA